MSNPLRICIIGSSRPKGTFTVGPKTLQWGGANIGAGGALAPPVYMLKKALIVGVKFTKAG